MGCSSLAQIGMIPGSSEVFNSCKVIWDPLRESYMEEGEKAVSKEVCENAHFKEYLLDNSVYIFLTASLITNRKKKGAIHAWCRIVYENKKFQDFHFDLDQYEDYDDLLKNNPEFYYQARAFQDQTLSMRVLSKIRDRYVN